MTKRPWTPSPDLRHRAHQLVHHNLTIDIHTHPQAIMPSLVRRAAERIAGFPRDPLANLAEAGVDLVVLTAVGDALGTAWRIGRPWQAVCAQLDSARSEAEAAGVAVNTSAELPQASNSAQVILGVEGADFLGESISTALRCSDSGVSVCWA